MNYERARLDGLDWRPDVVPLAASFAYDMVKVVVDAGVALVVLNRPEKLNAFTLQTNAELSTALAVCDIRDDVRAVVLTGAGRAFCAGGDMVPADDGASFIGGNDRSNFEAIPWMAPYQLRKPVIAAINGHAVGGGLTIALQCDIRLVAEDAKIGFAFVRRGIAAELGAHWLTTRLVGLSRAAELMFTGRLISGAEAAAVGLDSAALPADEVLSSALAVAREIVDQASPTAVTVTKRLLWKGLDEGLTENASREHQFVRWLMDQPDAVEGVTAFLEHRAPCWNRPVAPDIEEALRAQA